MEFPDAADGATQPAIDASEDSGRTGRLVALGVLLASTLTAILGGVTFYRRHKGRFDPQSEAAGRGPPGTPPSARALRQGYQSEDGSGTNLGRSLLVLGVAAAVFAGLMFVLLDFFHASDRARPALTAQQTAPIVPPSPHLQAHPHAEIAAAEKQESDLIGTYAWIGTGHTRARIPIGRAMALTVGHSLDHGPGALGSGR